MCPGFLNHSVHVHFAYLITMVWFFEFQYFYNVIDEAQYRPVCVCAVN